MAKWTLRPWCPVPWKEFIDPVGRVISDALNDVSKIGLRVDAVHFAGFDNGVDDRCAIATGIRSGFMMLSARQGERLSRPALLLLAVPEGQAGMLGPGMRTRSVPAAARRLYLLAGRAGTR
jgi:hypothetical protein